MKRAIPLNQATGRAAFARVGGAADARDSVLLCSLAAFLFVFGGGGSPAPLAELACEVAAALAVAVAVWHTSGSAPAPRRVHAVIALLALPPALQLVPLPPGLWQLLPGRDLVAAGLGLAGAQDAWRPLSIAPHRTLAALLSLGPPLAVLWLTARASPRARANLAATIAALALLSVLAGAAQIAQNGPGPFDFYPTNDAGVLHGFQANRNTEAIVLLVGLAALALAWRRLRGARSRTLDLAFAALGGLLLLGVVLTSSRSGIALTLVAVPFALAIVRAGTGSGSRSGRARWFAAAAAIVPLMLGAALWLLRERPPIARVLARFEFAGEFRPELWRDTWFAIGQYWPFGSGLGTFIPAFLPGERLEVVDATLPNRAHNEVLELLLEGGLPLLACWTVAIVLVLAGLRRLLGSSDPAARAEGWFAAAVLALAAGHSLVDYPLRSVAMASLVAVGGGIALASRRWAPQTGSHVTEPQR